MTVVLEARGITKQFPGVLANDHVDFTLERGEIHCLLGENGAGKTTLMNVLYGLYHPDAGEVRVNSTPVKLHDANDSIRLGIGMVHQHFMLIPVFTVAENVMLGIETVRGGRLDNATVAQRITDLSQQYGLRVNPNDYIKDLPVGVQQRVEILKVLYRHAEILILDEPTAVLTPQEADEFFAIMRSLAQQGKSIIFITHKLREVFAVADRISVMRGGKLVGTVLPKDATPERLAELMVGRKVILQVEKREKEAGAPALAVTDLTVSDDRGVVAVHHVSFEVRGGEILGIAGVQGNGQTELAEALTHLRPISGGHIALLGHDISRATPRQVIEAGVAHIPEDRHKHGLVLGYPVADNLVLCSYYLSPFARGYVLNDQAIIANAQTLIQRYDIRTPSAFTRAGALSGGNQQKVIVAREMSRLAQLIIAAQPTRGLDVGSIEFIHQQLIAARDVGVGVLLISAELDEIISLSDRIAVMYKGEILDIFDARTATREQIGLLMAGITPTAKKN